MHRCLGDSPEPWRRVVPSGLSGRGDRKLRGRRRCRKARCGVEDVDGAAGVDDFDGAVGVNVVGLGAGRDGRLLSAFIFRCAGPLISRRKGMGWTTSVVSRVSVMPMFPRVSMMSEGYSAAATVLCFGGDSVLHPHLLAAEPRTRAVPSKDEHVKAPTPLLGDTSRTSTSRTRRRTCWASRRMGA